MTATTLQNAAELAQLNLKAVYDLLTSVEDEINVDIGNPSSPATTVGEYIDLYAEARLIN